MVRRPTIPRDAVPNGCHERVPDGTELTQKLNVNDNHSHYHYHMQGN